MKGNKKIPISSKMNSLLRLAEQYMRFKEVSLLYETILTNLSILAENFEHEFRIEPCDKYGKKYDIPYVDSHYSKVIGLTVAQLLQQGEINEVNAVFSELEKKIESPGASASLIEKNKEATLELYVENRYARIKLPEGNIYQDVSLEGKKDYVFSVLVYAIKKMQKDIETGVNIENRGYFDPLECPEIKKIILKKRQKKDGKDTTNVTVARMMVSVGDLFYNKHLRLKLFETRKRHRDNGIRNDYRIALSAVLIREDQQPNN